jgi:hypothetical protein
MQKKAVRYSQLPSCWASPVTLSSGMKGPSSTPPAIAATTPPTVPHISAARMIGRYMRCRAENFAPPVA